MVAHNDVGGNHGVRDALAHLVQNVQELLGTVGAAHVLEHLVGAGLQRHVQHRHDVRGLRHRVNHVVGEHCRVRGGEAYTLQALNLTAGTQQLGECLAVAELHAVGVHVLAEQSHLDSAVIDQRLNLSENVAGAAVLLLTAQRRHDAEGAGIVTAHRDGHPAGVHVVALSRQGGGENFEGFEQFCLRLVVVAGALQ